MTALAPRGRAWSIGWGPAAVAGLAALIILVHGRALPSGLFMDDHAHFRQLRDCDWSLAGLTAACRLELVGGVIDLWWLPETTLRFFRPVAFGFMKLAYELSGWRPSALHAASLAWHLLNCTLILILLRRLGTVAWIAWSAASLFAIHPAHVGTVQWIACQTELMVTACLLGATLCFAQFRNWFPRDNHATPMAGRRACALASVLLFALALGCRENAAALPFLLALIDLCARRRAPRTAIVVYAALAAVLVTYSVVRTVSLGGTALPPRPYVISPGEPDFIRFVFDKFWYYLLGQYFLAPVVPIGGLPYLQGHPRLFYGLAAFALLLILLGAIMSRRGTRWVGPLWLVGFTLPLLPVFASPHHLYLPGVGWAITAAALFSAIAGPAAGAATHARWPRRIITGAAALLLAGVFGAGSYYSGIALAAGQGVERALVEEIATTPGGLHDGDTLYVANMPMIAHYARLAVEERTGRRNLRVVPLTWAPRLLGLVGTDVQTELAWVDERTLEMRVDGDRYFGGPIGQLLREVTGRDLPDAVDRRAVAGVRARVLARDADGVKALRFDFSQPLRNPGVHLFWGSRTRWACPVRPSEAAKQ